MPPDAQAGLFQPGCFHPGAIKPDFLTVDVRKSQAFPYDQWEYVTSDVTPGVMFRGQLARGAKSYGRGGDEWFGRPTRTDRVLRRGRRAPGDPRDRHRRPPPRLVFDAGN